MNHVNRVGLRVPGLGRQGDGPLHLLHWHV
jgi:hypothetical protein